MAHSKQSKKRIRQNEQRRLLNKAAASRMRTELRKLQAAVKSGDADAAQKQLPLALKRIDKAAKGNVIHWNQAARRKSQAMKAVAGLGSE